MNTDALRLKISDPLNNDVQLYTKEELSHYLDLPASHWTSGSGDSALWRDDTEGLMFFKYTTDLYFVMETSTYLSPIQNKNDVKWLSHQIGGDPFFFSSRHLCSKDVLLKTLIEYAKSGNSHSDFEWTDPIPSEAIFFELLNNA